MTQVWLVFENKTPGQRWTHISGLIKVYGLHICALMDKKRTWLFGS